MESCKLILILESVDEILWCYPVLSSLTNISIKGHPVTAILCKDENLLNGLLGCHGNVSPMKTWFSLYYLKYHNILNILTVN